MILCITGVNFKSVPIEIREKLSFQNDKIAEAYTILLGKPGIQECVILSTCNRVEIYAMVNEVQSTVLRDFLKEYHKVVGELEHLTYTKTGLDAVKHLCMVAAGLDSMVIGEPQIFGQVKDAFVAAQKYSAVQHGLDYLFTQVFSIVKRVRSKTRIGENNVSVCYAVVKLAKSVFDAISDKKVMILGAGEMGELTVRNLVSAGITDVIVANRTFQKAVEVAERFNGIPIMFHEVNEYLPSVDIIISSINTNNYILTKESVSQIVEGKNRKSLIIIDISVPRSVDPLVASVDNVHLYNIDNLRAVVDFNSKQREKEAQKAIAIIDGKVEELLKQLRTCDIVPTLVSIRTKAEEIRKDSILKATNYLILSDKEKNVIDTMTKAIVNKILNHSEEKLREYSNSIKQPKLKEY